MIVNVPCTLALLKQMFPRKGDNQAVTGRIPMDFFEQNETEIRAVMRAERLRAIYRGPRLSNNNKPISTPSMTRRCDAVAVMLYRV